MLYGSGVTLAPADTPQGQRAAFPQLPCQVAATVDDEQLEEAAAAANLGNLRRTARCVAFAETAAAEALEARAISKGLLKGKFCVHGSCSHGVMRYIRSGSFSGGDAQCHSRLAPQHASGFSSSRRQCGQLLVALASRAPALAVWRVEGCSE